MLRRIVQKRLVSQSIRPFSQTKGENVPTYDRAEFEPFKFKHERENLHYGYTLQELYGKRYGLKHSPQIRKEIGKDNIMIVVALLFTFSMALLNRQHQYEEDVAWENYHYHDMNYYRNKPAAPASSEDGEAAEATD